MSANDDQSEKTADAHGSCAPAACSAAGVESEVRNLVCYRCAGTGRVWGVVTNQVNDCLYCDGTGRIRITTVEQERNMTMPEFFRSQMADKPKPEASADCAPSGSWMDKWGACKVCDGEIPHGHSHNCDILKLELRIRRYETLLRRVLEWCDTDSPHFEIEADAIRDALKTLND